MSKKIAYEYLSKNISFLNIYKKDYTKLTHWFKKEEEKTDVYPWFSFPITDNEYELFLKDQVFDNKEELFEALDQACYPTHKLDDNDKKEVINYRKYLIGLMGNIEKDFEPDSVYETSYTINIYDPQWDGFQDGDYLVIHKKDNMWFINKTDAEDVDGGPEPDIIYENNFEDDQDYQDKIKFLERDNI